MRATLNVTTYIDGKLTPIGTELVGEVAERALKAKVATPVFEPEQTQPEQTQPEKRGTGRPKSGK